MSGVADAIRLREFTNVNPQIRIDEVGTLMSPRTGHTVEGLYVCQVGRVHQTDPRKLVLRPKFDLSIPDMSELGTIEVGPWNPFESTYSLSYSTGAEPIDKKYTPTAHKAPLPPDAKSPPTLVNLNPHLVHLYDGSNNSRDWNNIAEK